METFPELSIHDLINNRWIEPIELSWSRQPMIILLTVYEKLSLCLLLISIFETWSKAIAERSGLSENQTGIFTEDVFWKKWLLSEHIFQSFFDRFGNMVVGR